MRVRIPSQELITNKNLKSMSDIFINTEISRPPSPGHGNNCHGHFTTIANGGKGRRASYKILKNECKTKSNRIN